jgi:hypothetical protein
MVVSEIEILSSYAVWPVPRISGPGRPTNTYLRAARWTLSAHLEAPAT